MSNVTENIAKLIEANKLQSEIIDSLFIELMQYRSVDEAEMPYKQKMERVAEIMRDYQ